MLFKGELSECFLRETNPSSDGDISSCRGGRRQWFTKSTSRKILDYIYTKSINQFNFICIAHIHKSQKYDNPATKERHDVDMDPRFKVSVKMADIKTRVMWEMEATAQEGN